MTAMKLDAPRLGFATAAIVAMAWVLCSFLVFSAPMAMTQMSGQMMHTDFPMSRWSLHWSGFLIGLIAWSFISGLTASAIAWLYNRLLGDGPAK